jgi:hypothetical protein
LALSNGLAGATTPMVAPGDKRGGCNRSGIAVSELNEGILYFVFGIWCLVFGIWCFGFRFLCLVKRVNTVGNRLVHCTATAVRQYLFLRIGLMLEFAGFLS